MDFFWQDLRYGLRGIRNQPSFTALAVLTLALGIGSATTIFSVIHNVLLDPFPYKEANRVVQFQIRNAANPDSGGRTYFQTPEFLDYVEQNNVFEEVIAGGPEEVLCTLPDRTELLSAALVSGNTFTFLGVPAMAGRTLVPEDGKPGAPPVFLMAHKLWRRLFNLDPSIIGQTFILNGTPTTLVGVMPPRFTKLAADIYKPVILDRADPQVNERYFMLQAKPKPGVTLEQIEADLTIVAQRLAKVYPRNYPEKFTVKAVSWVENIVGRFRQTLYTLAVAVALLLLISCSNVANMLLARAAAREKEMAIRASVGASRARLIGQLLVESLLLAILGMIAGCGFAYFGLKAIVAAIPEGAIPREAVITLNGPVLLGSLGIAAITAIVFGLVPALQTARQDLVESLKDGSKGASGGFRRGKLRSTLVVLEVALSLVLLAGAGLLMRNFIKLQTVDLGFDADRILFARLPLPRGQYKTAAAKQQFFSQLLTRLQTLPGVVAVTATSSLPPYGGIGGEIDIPGRTHTERWNAIFQLCSEDYFRTLGLRLMRGRLLTETDVTGARKVAVVNQTFVNKYLAGEDPIGRQVQFKRLESLAPEDRVENATFEIVGVTADAKNDGIQDPIEPEAFLPYTITGAFERGVMLRTDGDPLALVNTLRSTIWAQDRGVAITLTDSLANFLKNFTFATPRFSLLVLGVFAGVGLVLVALGVYSVIAYTVSRQTHEIGIRMALGATRGDVLRLVMGLGGTLIGLGVLIGIATSLGVTHVLASQLWELSPRDPLTLAIVVGVVGIAGLAACYFPARRAMKVDPMVALRRE